MLSSQQLSELYRSHREERVLSVYLDASQTDPAARSAWYTRFRDGVRDLVRGYPEESEEREALERAAERIRAELGNPDSFLQGRGWVGFATESETLYAEGVPVPMPDLIRWEPGIRVAPYLRALKQARPIGVAVVDSRRARLYRYQDGTIEEFLDLRADHDFGDLSEGTTSKRAESTSGVRGSTGKDKGQTLKDAETRKMLDTVVTHLVELAGRDGTIVLGGSDVVEGQLRKALPVNLSARVSQRPRLTFDLSESEVQAEVEQAASELSQARQAALLQQVLDTARSRGAACLGRTETERAIDERRVRTLIVSDTLRGNEPDVADWLVGRAFEGGADAVEIGGAAADELDGDAGGVAALLHYRVDQP